MKANHFPPRAPKKGIRASARAYGRDLGSMGVTLLILWFAMLVGVVSNVDIGSEDDETRDCSSIKTWFSSLSLFGPYRRRKKVTPDEDIGAAFLDHYRCPDEFVTFRRDGKSSARLGYFRFGSETICYGKCALGSLAEHPASVSHDAMNAVRIDGSELVLPFNPSEVAENLRHERYVPSVTSDCSQILRTAYYLTRPFLGVPVRKYLQRMRLRGWRDIAFPRWPVDSTVESLFENLLGLLLKSHGVERIPFVWFWPDGFKNCVMVTHDIETRRGLDYCSALMDLDEAHGIKSSFQIVPEGRYRVPKALVDNIRGRGFEVNIHDLNHDGRLFSDKAVFLERSARINQYAAEYGAQGFRSAILYRNADWLEALQFEYDMSFPTIGHLDAQQGGCCSVLPFFIGSTVELPVTTTQDYSLFHILNDYSIDLWKQQIGEIRRRCGLVSFIIHPDYIVQPRGSEAYRFLLTYLAHTRSRRDSWFALPGEISNWWRQRNEMTLVRRSDGWEIEGPGKERAHVAYATLRGGRVVYDA